MTIKEPKVYFNRNQRLLLTSAINGKQSTRSRDLRLSSTLKKEFTSQLRISRELLRTVA